MTNVRRVSTLLLFFAGVLCFVIFLKDWGTVAMASASEGSAAPGFAVRMLLMTGAALVLIVIISMLPFPRRLIESARGRRLAARFLKRAEGKTGGGPKAVAVVSVPTLAHLPAAKGRMAMESLRLYLEGFIGERECVGRLDRFVYGLLLASGDSAAFSRRLEILKQDVGFLYMAAYPGMRISARVTACLEGGLGLQDALQRACSQDAAEGPDHGQP